MGELGGLVGGHELVSVVGVEERGKGIFGEDGVEVTVEEDVGGLEMAVGEG